MCNAKEYCQGCGNEHCVWPSSVAVSFVSLCGQRGLRTPEISRSEDAKRLESAREVPLSKVHMHP
jgi:hypothetical protein